MTQTFIQGIKEKVEGDNIGIDFNSEISILRRISDYTIQEAISRLLKILAEFQPNSIQLKDLLNEKFKSWYLANVGENIGKINEFAKNTN